MTRTQRMAPERALKPGTTRKRRPTLTIAALTGSLILAGIVAPATAQATPTSTAATTVATAPVAAATPLNTAVKKAPSIKVSTSKKKWAKGSTPAKVGTKVVVAGKAATGKAQFYVGKKRVATKTLKNGKATYRLSKKLSAKKHTVTVRYLPTGSAKNISTTGSKATRVQVKASKTDKVLAIAKAQVGVKYRSGGTSPSRGFDCSGFTQYVYKKAGVKKLPRTSSAQKRAGKRVSRSAARPGDLVWSPGHVAIYAGNGKIIDAPRPGKKIAVRKMWQSNPVFIRL